MVMQTLLVFRANFVISQAWAVFAFACVASRLFIGRTLIRRGRATLGDWSDVGYGSWHGYRIATTVGRSE